MIESIHFFNDEFDLLEIRLHELYPVVDAFILVEADFTFQNKPKPLRFKAYIASHPARFQRFSDKIVHVTLRKPADIARHVLATGDPWALEVFCRDAVAKIGIESARDFLRNRTSKYESGIPLTSPDDLLMITDVDEIPRREIVQVRIKNVTVKSIAFHVNLVFI